MPEEKVVPIQQVDGPKVIWIEATENKFLGGIDIQINEARVKYNVEGHDLGLRYGPASIRFPVSMTLTVLKTIVDVYNASMGTYYQIVDIR